MRDVVVLVIIAGFFLLCVAYVRWCDSIIGPDPDGLRDVDAPDDEDVDEVAAAAVVDAPAGVDAAVVR
jgi:hypothetical protein